jgi:hypothetical protein
MPQNNRPGRSNPLAIDPVIETIETLQQQGCGRRGYREWP